MIAMTLFAVGITFVLIGVGARDDIMIPVGIGFVMASTMFLGVA